MVFIILLIIVFAIIYIYMSRDSFLKKQVDVYGGIENKYAILLSLFNGRILATNRGAIQLETFLSNCTGDLYIIERKNMVEIQWDISLIIGKKCKGSFLFPDNYDQYLMHKDLSVIIERAVYNSYQSIN